MRLECGEARAAGQCDVGFDPDGCIAGAVDDADLIGGADVQPADVVEGPFAAVIERTDGGYAVRVSVVAARIAPGERGVMGKLVLVSNDPAESRKEVPLFGMGAIPLETIDRR